MVCVEGFAEEMYNFLLQLIESHLSVQWKYICL